MDSVFITQAISTGGIAVYKRQSVRRIRWKDLSYFIKNGGETRCLKTKQALFPKNSASSWAFYQSLNGISLLPVSYTHLLLVPACACLWTSGICQFSALLAKCRGNHIFVICELQRLFIFQVLRHNFLPNGNGIFRLCIAHRSRRIAITRPNTCKRIGSCLLYTSRCV